MSDNRAWAIALVPAVAMVAQRADATFDRGKTWIRDYWTMEVHRISR